MRIIEREFTATPELVWDLLTSDAGIAQWWDGDSLPEITELVPYQRLTYRSTRRESEQFTVVVFEATDRGTRVSVNEQHQPSHPRSFAMSAA
jgi:uncharacterized protein YndB with AHSA1/START domain